MQIINKLEPTSSTETKQGGQRVLNDDLPHKSLRERDDRAEDKPVEANEEGFFSFRENLNALKTLFDLKQWLIAFVAELAGWIILIAVLIGIWLLLKGC